MLHWISLLCAGCLEMAGVALMNQYAKEKSVKWVLLIIVGFAASFSLLSYAMETIPMGTAYAVWTGIGTAGGALVGILFTRNRKTPNGSSLSR